MKNGLLYTCLVVLLSACGPGSLEPNAYVEWVENPDKGLSVQKEFGELVFRVQYKPLDYVVLQEQGINASGEALEAARKEYEGLQYFNFRIQLKNGGNVLSYRTATEAEGMARIPYFSFSLKNDLKLLEDGQELPCVLFLFSRNYNLAPTLDFALGFEASPSGNRVDKIFRYEDKIFGLGIVQLAVTAEALKALPTLKR